MKHFIQMLAIGFSGWIAWACIGRGFGISY
jgi:hypothetical protein